jgi:polyhydroxyalkanoate synthesis regulator phasin
VTKKTKHVKKLLCPLVSQGSWVRSNNEEAHDFSEHLADVFQLQPSESEPKEEEALIQLLEALTILNHQSNI